MITISITPFILFLIIFSLVSILFLSIYLTSITKEKKFSELYQKDLDKWKEIIH